MSVDRRATCARCFVFGDVRSVEATLEAFDLWRDPADPRRRVESLVLAGDPVHVFATAEGIRDLEMLRGERFGFALRVATSVLRRPFARAFAADSKPPDGDDPLVMLDADESMEATALGRRALQSMMRHRGTTGAPLAIVLRTGARLARSIAREIRHDDRGDVIRYDGRNPFLLPTLEGWLADRSPQRILVGGRGARVFSTAIGAGDFFLERGGDAASLTRSARERLIERSLTITSFTWDAPEPHTFDHAAALATLDVAPIDGPFQDDADGVLVCPVAA